MATLRVQKGPLAGQTFEVVGELMIGREHSGVTLEDSLVSRRHAVVRTLPGALEVEDLGSTNGTYVDGERLRGRTSVRDGAEIRIGTTVFEVEGVVVEVTRERRILDPDVTRLDAPPAPDVTRERARPAPPPPEPVAPREPAAPVPREPVAPAEPVAPVRRERVAAPAAAVGAVPSPPPTDFSPPPMRRGTLGLASRSWLPVVLSFGSVILTAIALVVYFGAR